MPPRVVKGPGLRRKVAVRSTPKQRDTTAKGDELEVEKEPTVEDVVESKLEEQPTEGNAAASGSVGGEDGLKDILNEDNYEQIQLDDNDPEYECEEETAVDYDEKMMDDNDDQEVDEEEVEEGNTVEEGQGDLVDEEIEAGGEDVEDVEDGGDVEDDDHENIEEGNEVADEEHHEVVKERRKRKEFEVFVGGLDKNATESDLRKIFSEVGEITEIRLLRNSQTKKNKGFAFLRFATVEQAKRAVADLKNPVVNGKQCGVTPSEDNDTLFLGNICKTWTKEHLMETLKNYGINNIEDLTLVEDVTKEGMNRGFAFLEFSSRYDAMDAYRCLRKRDVVLGVDRAAKVSFADSFIEPDDEIMSQVKTVFVDGISPSWDEERIKEHVKKFGKVEKVELARNMLAAKRKDFGFVTFDTHEAAVTCVESIKNAWLGEGDNKVKVRVRLSIPLQFSRGKHTNRGDFRTGRLASRDSHLSWGRFPARRFPPMRTSRESIGFGAPIGGRIAPVDGRGVPVGGHGPKNPIGFRDRLPALTISGRTRHLPPPARSYGRRPPSNPVYPKSSSNRGYDMQGVPASRTKAVNGHGSRIITERRSSYGHEYSRQGVYSDIPPRTLSRTASRRAYIDEGYGRKTERYLPPYRDSRGRDYDSISGSKRPYSVMDDPHPRFADVSMRQSRAKLDYDGTDGTVPYEDSYGERLGRSHIGYSRTRISLSEHDTHETYEGRLGMSYSGGPSTSDVGRMHSSSGYTSSYLSRDADVGGSSYTSAYSARSLGGNGYVYGSGSGSYY